MSVKKQINFFRVSASIGEGPPRRFMEKDIPPNSVDLIVERDFLHDAPPCSGFKAQTCPLFRSQRTSLAVDKCASGLDDGPGARHFLCEPSGPNGAACSCPRVGIHESWMCRSALCINARVCRSALFGRKKSPRLLNIWLRCRKKLSEPIGNSDQRHYFAPQSAVIQLEQSTPSNQQSFNWIEFETRAGIVHGIGFRQGG